MFFLLFTSVVFFRRRDFNKRREEAIFLAVNVTEHQSVTLKMTISSWNLSMQSPHKSAMKETDSITNMICDK